MTPFVTLLTDFGTADGYVGEVKGVLASLAPHVTVVDIAHDVAPHDVEGARLALARYWRRFPEGTVHLVVVDPGVGGARAALAMESEGRILVGPDNGVLSPALLHAGARCVSLTIPTSAAPTFHGRDVFAPAAAHLALGAALESLGVPLATPLIRRTPEATRRDDGGVQGEVITVDRFGNAVTNLLALRGGEVEIDGLALIVRRTYADAAPGEPTALVGSSGLVEIAVRDGSAATLLGLRRGSGVVLRSPR
ncbi:MAG TPA: SAM-dependent chlorinase/fluorinase [Gemmatimonadaceae bacterium]|nr:SAM-dependent chlorinase/fluorinase [Gemmatimonadaceae bacterium]